MRTSLYLFAHQDDEFSVFADIERERGAGNRVVCVYLTNGSGYGHDGARRNRETCQALATLDVAANDIHFVGASHDFPDGRLIGYLSKAWPPLREIFRASPVERLVIPAWEGGHPDHDAVHVLGLRLARETRFADGVWQTSLYRALRPLAPLFRVLSPLRENGPCAVERTPLLSRLRYLALIRYYRSQWRTWLALYPFFFIWTLCDGRQRLQPLQSERVREKPHRGRLLYESRRQASYQSVAVLASSFLTDER